MEIKQYLFQHPHGMSNQLSDLISRANHFGVFRDCGLDVKQYRYYDKRTISLDLEGMIDDIKAMRCYRVG
jgi:aspartate/tyrosine/aromatic aminotransferase